MLKGGSPASENQKEAVDEKGKYGRPKKRKSSVKKEVEKEVKTIKDKIKIFSGFKNLEGFFAELEKWEWEFRSQMSGVEVYIKPKRVSIYTQTTPVALTIKAGSSIVFKNDMTILIDGKLK